MLPLAPPIAPMLAKPVGDRVPDPDSTEDGLSYEPKFDGFRCLVFRDRSSVVLQSRAGEDLGYCFPEVVAAARLALPTRVVLDGELVVANDGRLSFEDLTQRIRPRSETGGWKIAELAAEHPASYVAFDVLALDDADLSGLGFARRRAQLEGLPISSPFFLTPSTDDVVTARSWFAKFEGAGLDGVVAKPRDAPYSPGRRTMLKVKHARTADVVVAGWRAHKQPAPDGRPAVGSLLLGLYDDQGRLRHVGVAAGFSAARRAELRGILEPFAVRADAGHPRAELSEPARRPLAASRWSAGKDLSFFTLRRELVAEVAFDHMEGDRFRHVTRLVRFRPDRTPESCDFGQLTRPVRFDLADVIPGLH